ncbi:SusC/RagA family TonB-linked outer membrane protein [Parabacteroides johnsonii]|uniref:SusC/RagA family TonB-linked outer membrane protein n=1 Tax=Parabacteroides johnsonii TaxID=387661 RepID=UPI0011DCC326|nr:TonB-dependent receptor [Parabacteroides johnsonii]
MKLTNLIPIKAGKTLSRLCIIGALSLGSSFVFAQNQQVRLSGSNLTLKAAFKQIEQQTKLFVDYNTQDVNDSRVIKKVPAGNNVKNVLEQLLEGTNCSITFSNGHVIISRKAPVSSETKKVTGVVKDEKGEPIIGANVVEKGTTNGIITDIDGNFELEISVDGVLAISYIGYLSQEINIENKKSINVILIEDSEKLEEVVVVGYGTQKKVNLTGSVVNIKAEELLKRQVGQSSMLLQGIAPGVTVTQTSGQPGKDGGNIRVRGVGTLSDSNPLVLVDGVEMSINNIDPNIIDNISVLKDASSSSIYGSRAANGVILVTTKRAGISKPSFSYNGYFGFQSPTTLPEKVNALDHMILLDEAYTNTGKSPIFTDKIDDYKKYAKINPDLYPDTDWQKEMLKTGTIQNHFVSVHAGNEHLKVLSSFGYLKQNGNLENTEFERFSFKINTDMQITKNLNAKLDVFLRQNKTTEPARGMGQIFFEMNREPAILPGVFTNGNYGEGATGYNPIAWAKDGGTNISSLPNALLNFNINYKPIDWLTVDISYVPYFVFEHTKKYEKSITLYNADGSVYMVNPAKTKLDEKYTKSTNTTLKGSVQLEKSFKKHNFKFLLGISRESYSNYWFSAYRETFLLPDYNVLNAGGEENKDNAGSGGGWALQSFFGRFNYDILGKYLFEVNGRYDGSSRFAEGNKYSFFPSVSVGWRISEESFMSRLRESWLDNLKIRGSWGKLGNQNIGNNFYPYSSNVSLTNSYTFGGTVVSGALLEDMANSDLSWETSEMYNVGLDLNLLGKLNITSDYFYKKTTGILLALDIPGIIGLEAPFQNAGIVSNKGWELGISYRDHIGNFKYEFGANISDVINKVIDLKGISKTSLTQSREGYPINSIYGLIAEGLFRDEEEISKSPIQKFGQVAPGDIKYRDITGDNIINAEDQQIIGSTIPRYTYSFNINLAYKGIDFSMFWQGVGKADGYLNSSAIIPFFNGGTVHEQHKDRWTIENQNIHAAFPRYTIGEANNSQNSSFWLKNAAYLRLKNIQLGYTFHPSWINKMGLKHLRVYVSGENLLTIDRFWDGFDVESPIGNGSFYPQLKAYSFGLNIRF